MKPTISRTITTTTVHYVIIEVKDGKAEMSETYTTDLLGKIDEEKAQKTMKPMFDKPFTIVSLEQSTKTYEMDVEQFINYATIIKEEK